MKMKFVVNGKEGQRTPFSGWFRELPLNKKNQQFPKSLWMGASGGSYLLRVLHTSYYIPQKQASSFGHLF